MKRALLAAILAATIYPAAAQTKNFCAQAHDLVVSIALARDRGVPLSQQHEIVDKSWADNKPMHAIMIDVVDEIYSQPTLSPRLIGGNFLKGCLKGASKGGV